MSLYGALAEHPEQRLGREVYTITGALDASGELAVSPGFAQIDAVHANIQLATAPTTSALTWSFADGVVTIHGWKATATADTALVASDAEETVSVTIIGRRRQ